MKTIKAILLLLMVPAFMYANGAKQKSETIYIKTSAACDECKGRILSAVNALDGVKKANLNLDDKRLMVKYDPSKLSADQIRDAVSKSGYDADDVKADKDAFEKLPMCCRSGCMGEKDEKGEKHEMH